MLRRFFVRRKVPLVPASWLNAVANILNNPHSPKGTISAKLDGDGEGATLNLDINPAVAATQMRDHLAANFLCKGDSRLLGDGLVWGERGLTIDKEWLAKQVIQAEKI